MMRTITTVTVTLITITVAILTAISNAILIETAIAICDKGV